MVHVAADGEALVVVEIEAEDIQEVYGTLAMMVTAYFIEVRMMGGA